MRRVATTAGSAVALFAGMLLLWSGAIRWFDIQPYMLPGPKRVFDAAVERMPSLGASMAITAEAATGGLAAAIVVGVTIALVFAQSRWLRTMFYPYTILFQTVPIVAIAPLVLMWVGPGTFAVGLFAFIICVSPIIANTTQGLVSVERGMVDLFLMNNASPTQILFRLRMPHAMSAMFTGIRISAGVAVVGAIIGETYAGSARVGVGGLGYAISYANSQMETDYLFALVGAATLLGFCFFFSVMFLEWVFLHQWHESARGAEVE